MAIYKTYREAVLANGSTRGVYLNYHGDEFYTDESWRGRCAAVYTCNPGDYLESLESFLESGKQLMNGDYYVEDDGEVFLVSRLGSKDSIPRGSATRPMTDDDERFILQAAADQVETPEEKEAFDAIDTTPQQVESLSGSEKPNKSEWNGEGLPPVGDECEFNYPEHRWNSGFYHGLTQSGERIVEFKNGSVASLGGLVKFRKPETPAESEQRDRLEAAYDLYCVAVRSDGDDPHSFKNWRKMTCSVKANLAIVDKTGYRKQ